MKKGINKIGYFSLKTFWKILSLIPLKILYLLSDFIYFVVYYLSKYRRKIVRKNLNFAFPQKSEKELIKIEKDFYRFFCDIFFETSKIAFWSEKKIMKHLQFVNYEEINELIRQKKSISLFLGHYGNWEWVSSMSLWLDKSIAGAEIYKPLKNTTANKIIIENRERYGVKCVEMKETLWWINEQKNNRKVSVTGYIADQSPSKKDSKYFVNFLNKKVPAYIGAEKITKKYNFEAYYVEVQRIKRGYYVAEFKKLHQNPAELPETELTKIFYRQLEKTIQNSPACYLWSHNRFKYALIEN